MKEFFLRREITEPYEEDGIIVRRDLMLQINQGVYILHIATPRYIDDLKRYNEQFEEDLKLDENILPINSVADLDELISKLSEMPSEDIEPFLVKQREVPDAN